jgi:hypothetical protein
VSLHFMLIKTTYLCSLQYHLSQLFRNAEFNFPPRTQWLDGLKKTCKTVNANFTAVRIVWVSGTSSFKNSFSFNGKEYQDFHCMCGMSMSILSQFSTCCKHVSYSLTLKASAGDHSLIFCAIAFPSIFIFSLSSVMYNMNYLNQKILSCSLISEKYHIYPSVRWEFF